MYLKKWSSLQRVKIVKETFSYININLFSSLSKSIASLQIIFYWLQNKLGNKKKKSSPNLSQSVYAVRE